MTFVFWVWRPGVSVCVLLLLYVCDGAEGVIRRHCDCYEEDMYVQKDIGGFIQCSLKPGLGPYAECTEISDLRSGLEEVFPDVRSLCILHSSSSLPADAFSHIPLLEHLYVDGSHLAKVTSGAFAGLSKLRFLHILVSSSWGGVNVTLEPGVFQGLSSLEELTLAGMSLALAPPALLDPLVGVRRLRVDRAGVRDLGELFCLLSPGMENLETLELPGSMVSSIQNGGCSGSNPWPTVVLSRIRILDLSGNPVRRVEPKSLAVFQNLSSLSLSMVDVWLGQLWGSGMGRVNKLYLSSYTSRQFSPSLSDLCTLVVKHGVESLDLHLILITSFTAEDMKRCGPGLRQLSVTSENLSGMDLGFWIGTGQIQGLVMVLTKLTNASFCSAGGGRVWNLTSLILHDNHLTEITTDQFSCMPLLERLDLSRNHISSLAHRALQGMPFLRVLNLTHNKISLLGKDDFEGLPALEVLLLEGNKISGGIADGVFRRQHRLQDLSLGEIDTSQLYLNMLFLGFPPKLQHLLIDTGKGTYLTMGHVPAPEVPMVLELRGKAIQAIDCHNNMFPMVRELKVGVAALFGCNSFIFLAPYFLNLQSFEFSSNPDKVATPYTTINQLRKLKRLKLTNVNLSNQKDRSVTFRNLRQLRSLVLINCRLNFLTRIFFSPSFSFSLLYLSLSPSLSFSNFLPPSPFPSLPFPPSDNSRKTQVVLLQRQQCIWHYQRLNFLSTMERLCQTEDDFLSYVSTTAAVCTLLCLALGYRFLRWPCVVLFFRLRGWVERRVGKRWWRRKRRMGGQWEELIEVEEGEEKEEEEVRYDAFVSFSSRDEAWVLGEMAPMLEEEGEPRLRLCLHHRDFEVGKGIVDNIAENIYCSRRTVCVLTRRYLRSDWCGLEMRVATHRLLSEHSHRLILIFLEHISPFELSAFHRLAKLARTRTYLDWPQDEDERVTFWERLRRNIAERDTDELHDPPEAS
uniref:TIR domain-containing protein n=1 Tax=Hucho hucho TaxID=62062 RepID=A0A4W5RFM8_9TELE